MIIQPMHAYSRRSATGDIEESMKGAAVLASERIPIPLPLRTIYPARKKGESHAYFPEGVKEGLEYLSVQAMTGRLDLTKGLELLGVSSTDIGLNPGSLDHAFIVGVEYEGQANPTKPLSLHDLGMHITTQGARCETQETVRTTA